MKFGNIVNPRIEVVSDIKNIIDMGFDFVELNFVEPEGTKEVYNRKAQKIRQFLEENNVFAYAHMPPAMDFGSVFPFIREAWLNEARMMIDVAAKIGIKKLNFHALVAGESFAGVNKSAVKKARMDNIILGFEELMEYAKKFGVGILYENTWEDHDDFEYIATSIDELEINIDVSHAFLGGMKNVMKFLNMENIGHLHMSDNHGKYDEHLQLGKGKIDFPAVAKKLKDIDYDKTVTLEIFTKNRQDAGKSLKYIKSIFDEIK